jgi:nucleoid-associated protein YgaU
MVRHGESLWSIAESVVIAENPAANEHQVAEYWHRLIESNRSTLRNPSNVDLLYPGDIVTLPTPS